MPRQRKVSWHKTGRWYFTHTGTDGKRKSYYATPEFPRTEAGRRKATNWMEEKLKELSDRTVMAGDWTLDDLRLAYLTWCKRQVAGDERSQHTLRGHREHLNLICATPRGSRTYGEILARDLTTHAVATLVELWKKPRVGADGIPKPGIGPVTINNRVGSLNAMLNWATKPRDDRPIERLIDRNPIAGYESARAPYQGDRYAPSQEIDAFLAWLEARAKGKRGKRARFERMTALMIRVAAETGCRPGELCVFQWEHFKVDRTAIVLPPNLHKTGRKTNRPRIIALTMGLVVRLEALRGDIDRHPTHIFTHQAGDIGKLTAEQVRQGAPWNSSALAKKVLKLRAEAIRAGVLADVQGVQRMHLYRLRHTKITNALQGGANPIDVAKMSGNSVKIIEDVYLHPQIDHLVRVQAELTEKESQAKESGAT